MTKTLVLLALLAAASARPETAAALSAADFDVFSLGGIRYSDSDFQGRVGAAGAVDLLHFSLGERKSGAGATLIAGSASLVSGHVYNGGVRAVGLVAWSHWDVGVDGGVRQKARADAEDLAAVSRELLDLSDRLAALAPDPGPDPALSGVLLLAARPGAALTVLRVPAADLAAARVVLLRAERGQTLVLDVLADPALRDEEKSAALENVDLRLTGAGGVVFNFPDARRLSLTGVGVPGTVLAPRARTVFTSGRVDGRLYVGDLEGDGQVNRTASTALADALSGSPAVAAPPARRAPRVTLPCPDVAFDGRP